MNKIKNFFGVLVAIFVFISTGFVIVSKYIKRLFKESPQEAIQYNQHKIIDIINKQLEGINIQNVIDKEEFIFERSIDELQESVAKGQITYTDITIYYLDRIRKIDQNENGYNSIAEINPRAVEIAKEYDLLKPEEIISPLYGLPVTIKDNINTIDMPTSAGTYAFRDFIPEKDAEVVQKIKESGALILAKVNLSELANFVDYKTPSGYSSKVGQTRNPFAPLELSPLGSSSGSAVSITSNIGVLSIGTETVGSIVAPSAIQSVVGMKPVIDSVSTKGVFPLSSTMDTVGPIAKTVIDTIYGYNAIVNNSRKKIDVSLLDIQYLKGKRIGIIATENYLKNALCEVFEKAGATIIDVKFDNSGINILDIITNDFKFDFANFAIENNLPIKNLQELIEYNKVDMFRRARYGQIHLENSNSIKENNFKGISRQVILAKRRLDALRERYDLDVFVSFNADDISLPAVAGHTYITVPFGQNENNIPQGCTFIAGEGEEKELFNFAYAFEQETHARMIPKNIF